MKVLNLALFLAICLSTVGCSKGEAMQDLSYIQRIELDLTNANVDKSYTVKARQIFYDVGQDSVKNGYVSIKINSIQSAPISLSPGGEINHDDIREIFVSNPAQVGKSVVLLASYDASVNTPPINPLNAGVPKTLNFTPLSSYSLVSDYVNNQQFLTVIIDPAANDTGILIHNFLLNVRTVDHRDVVTVSLIDFVGQKDIAHIGSPGGLSYEFSNLYLQPGVGILIQSDSSVFGARVPAFANGVGLSVAMLYEVL